MMELSEYRKRTAENRARFSGTVAGLLGAADATGPQWLDPVQEAILTVPWHGGWSLVGVAGGGIVSTFVTRYRRTTDRYQRLQRLHDRAWAGVTTRRKHIGLAAARRSARSSRPDLSRYQRARARPDAVGIPVGSTVSGPPSARRSPIVLPWDLGGVLLLGETGARKSTFLKGTIVRLPGPGVVVSTKTELAQETGQARRRSDDSSPVAAFCPLSWSTLPEHVATFRWSLVRGCTDPRIAQRRAQALMEATEASGLSGGKFWEGKGRQALTALLCAAAYGQVGLRQVASWLQRSDYREPADILDRNSDQVEPSMVDTLRALTNPQSNTVTSISHTASSVLEFLSDGVIADALDPAPGQEIDLTDFVRRDGTLYLVSDDSPALAPVISAIWDSIIAAAKTVAGEHSSGRLPRPLALVADEIDKTLPSVPIDQHAAELRGWGVVIVGATQNHGRLQAVWGQDRAGALTSSLQTHIVLSLNSQSDREYYERRIGKRKVEYIKESYSKPNTLKARMSGNPSRDGHSRSESPETQYEPLWTAESWSHLETGLALVIPTKGSAAVVDTGNGAQTARVAGSAVTEALEQAERQRAAERAAAGAAEPATAEEGGGDQ